MRSPISPSGLMETVKTNSCMAKLNLGRQSNKFTAFLIVIFTISFIILVSSYYNSRVLMHQFENKMTVLAQDGLSRNQVPINYSVSLPVSLSVIDNEDVTQYGIVFDAGSTGSRIHIFEYSLQGTGGLKLINETFEAIKPGLSGYSDVPKKGAESLLPLLERAKQIIPSKQYGTTPVMLRATAGLRLLPASASDALLMEIEALFTRCVFATIIDGVKILDGHDEGIFSWITVNFLLGALTGGAEKVAALDMGGGSTQVALVPKAEGTVEGARPGDIIGVKFFKNMYRFFTHSFLGLGLMSARLQVMGRKDDPRFVTSLTSNVLTTPCLPYDYNSTWSHQGTDYIVRGANKSDSGFLNCYESVKRIVLKKKYRILPIPDLNDIPVYLFSYYFDRARDAHIIKSASGGELMVKDYKRHAERVCQPDHSLAKRPFLCLDLTFLYSMLQDGLRIHSDTKLQLKKKIDGVEISWALGALFNLIGKLNIGQQS